jgi:hypothetical protein
MSKMSEVQYKPKIFISHSANNESTWELINNIFKGLEKGNFSPFLDRKVKKGQARISARISSAQRAAANNEPGAQTIVDDLKPRWEKRFENEEDNEEQNPLETSPAISDSTAGDQS